MRHRVGGNRLSRVYESRKALLNNLATSLFKSERIVTTLAKAKVLRSTAEKLITLAKKGGLASIRQIEQSIKEKSVLFKLLNVIAPRFKDRNGGYTRILKYKNRKGDDALVVIIELVVRQKKEKKLKKGEKPEEKNKEKGVEVKK
ncbi:MAG: 50S ribosomal protein L17 [Candidatus Firestonebacteria bacterium]|jgi:large subunit ribosomal protein L17|nr:50S ribosomal protein L17 [Candidatus Firestonebacteria bacterium]